MMVLSILTRCVSHPQEAGGDWVERALVEFVEVAFGIDEDGALHGFFGGRVVAEDVMGEVVEDFQRKEEAGRRDVPSRRRIC